MSMKKPTVKSGKNAAVIIGGVVLGVMASRVLMGYIDDPSTATDAKKAEQATTLKRTGLLIVGGVGAAVADAQPASRTNDLLKAFSAGFAADSGLALFKTGAEKMEVTPEAEATTTGKKALARAFGLGCACNGVALNGRRSPRRKGLNASYDLPAYEYSNMDAVARPGLNGGLLDVVGSGLLSN